MRLRSISEAVSDRERKMRTVIVACVVALVAAVSAQTPPDCAELDVGASEPLTGVDLPYCLSNDLQCCSADYLERVKEKVQQELNEGLRDEFQNVIDQFEDELDNLLDFFEDVFPENFLIRLLNGASIEVDSESPAIANVLDKLANNLETLTDDDDFDVQGFIVDLLGEVIANAEGNFGQAVSTLRCITNQIDKRIKESEIGVIVRHFREIRKSLTSLKLIDTFLNEQTQRLEGDSETIVEECVATFINIAFCSRCTRKTPPMCFHTCNALLRGCYSPYYTALNRQYQRLWMEVQRIVRLANSTVEALLTDELSLLDIDSLASDAVSECGIDVDQVEGNQDNANRRAIATNRRNRKQAEEPTEDDPAEEDTTDEDDSEDTTGDSDSSLDQGVEGGTIIPFGLVDDLFELTGALEYGEAGLTLCIDALDGYDPDNCTAPDVLTDDVYSEGDDIDTSKCYCTDGTQNIMNDEAEQFISSDIEEQGDNPVLGEALIESLQTASALISQMEDPVAAFLSSDEYTSAAPQDQEGSSAGVVVSLSILLLSLLAALM